MTELCECGAVLRTGDEVVEDHVCPLVRAEQAELELKFIHASTAYWCKRAVEAEAEVERLRALVEEYSTSIRAAVNDRDCDRDALVAERDEARAARDTDWAKRAVAVVERVCERQQRELFRACGFRVGRSHLEAEIVSALRKAAAHEYTPDPDELGTGARVKAEEEGRG